MSSLFASIFPNLGAAEKAQRLVEKAGEDRVIKLVSTVVIEKVSGEVVQHHSRSPGARSALLVGIAGGVLGLLAGPVGSLGAAAAGALSGGWFDMLREGERQEFLEEIARGVERDQAALLCEVINPSEDAKKLVEQQVAALGGQIVGLD